MSSELCFPFRYFLCLPVCAVCYLSNRRTHRDDVQKLVSQLVVTDGVSLDCLGGNALSLHALQVRPHLVGVLLAQ